jgi:serine/threonine protein kinase
MRQALFLIATRGRPPFKRAQDFSPALGSFVDDCLTSDQDARPSSAQLLDHTFLSVCSNADASSSPLISLLNCLQ